jgi:hypothetical protein
MRITLTLRAEDGQLFSAVREASGMEFVEPAVYARHLFLAGLKSVALSQDRADVVKKSIPTLADAAKERRKGKRKAKR